MAVDVNKFIKNIMSNISENKENYAKNEYIQKTSLPGIWFHPCLIVGSLVRYFVLGLSSYQACFSVFGHSVTALMESKTNCIGQLHYHGINNNNNEAFV